MEFKGINNSSKIIFEIVEKETSYYPSASFNIEIENNNFSTTSKEIWFDIKGLKKFTNTNIDEGENKLESMSPNEFVFSIKNIDDLGHKVIQYKLTKNTYIQNKLQKNEISSVFEIENTEVEKIQNYFKGLINEMENVE